jgi:hypothetical protein
MCTVHITLNNGGAANNFYTTERIGVSTHFQAQIGV